MKSSIRVFRHFILDRWGYKDLAPMPLADDLAEVVLSVVKDRDMCDDCSSIDHFVAGLVAEPSKAKLRPMAPPVSP